MRNILILILSFLVSTIMSAQVKLADNFFRDYAYKQATELYLEAVKKGDSSEHVLSRIGDCYYNNSNVKEAHFWYEKAVSKYEKLNAEYIYKYIQTLRSLGEYEKAQKWTENYASRKSDDKRIKNDAVFDVEMFKALESTEKVYVDYKNLELNSAYSDFGGFESENMFYFSSTRPKDSIIDENKLYQWNKEPFLNIYQAELSIDNAEKKISNVSLLASDIVNSDFHEASIAITKDGKTLYFTRDNLNKRNSRATYDKEGTSNLRLFKANLVDGKWTNLEDLPFNSKDYSNGSPALSPDNKTLYFVSDRPNGFGQTDIYKVAIKPDGTYGEPKNLGANINTEGRENFPFIAKDSTFYFSSDSRINLGLLDIFESNILKAKDKEVEVKNLGAPFNSGYDDFAFFIDSETNTGYFSSNRPDGKGGDDIYAFGKLECTQIIRGVTKDLITQMPLAQVTVKLMDGTGKVIESIVSDDNGEYEFLDISCDSKYIILGEKVTYRSDKREFTTSIVNEEETQIDLFLSPLIIESEIVINPIFFDFNKSDIRPDAAYELENIVAVMKEHTMMVIKIESHTDSRGRDKYNLKLSDRRAKSTRDYLISRGISENRIESAIGYGESQLINDCDDNSKCTEEEHQKNRRSKFIITDGYTAE
ncbi:MAG: OmpA family protein [Bizionia paragorgiae]|uniref:OmpA family protein n=1 Tax=Bizionia paragorgiae TaxID=283786 RepID=UPI003C577D9E